MDISKPKEITISVENGNTKELFFLQSPTQKKHPLFASIYRLTLMGGIANFRVIQGDAPKNNNILRGLRRSKKVRALGAGYFALASLHVLPVNDWLKRVLSQCKKPISKERCIELILAQYPHGHPKDIEMWLCNRLEDIIVESNHVRLG